MFTEAMIGTQERKSASARFSNATINAMALAAVAAAWKLAWLGS